PRHRPGLDPPRRRPMRLRPKTLVLALSAAAVCSLATASLLAQVTKKAAPLAGGAMMSGGITKAIAVLHATKSGGEVSGEGQSTKVQGGVHVHAEIRGLPPGPHGFHIHEWGDCSSPDAMSAGGHFNPMAMEHGDRTAGARHVGDLGNIVANERGLARLDVDDPMLAFSGPASIIGRGLIVHEKADDLNTPPTGNAGGRLACGVIGVAKP